MKLKATAALSAILFALPFVTLRAEILPSVDKLAGMDVLAYAKNSVNSPSFRKNSVCSWKDTHYAAYYSEDGYVNLLKWQGDGKPVQKKMAYRGRISDAHNVISIMVDGDGVLHLACDHHNNRLHYFRADAPGSLEMKECGMIGTQEDKLSYPEFYRLANGDLIFLYRDGGSGNGNMVMNRYDLKTKTWSRIHTNLIDGEGKRNAYWQFCVGPDGVMHVTWVWRESPDVASNHDLCYARSKDGGKTWENSAGKAYSLPITMASAEIVWKIPQKSELMNQTAIVGGEDGISATATYWRDQDSTIPNFRIVWFDGKQWHAEKPFERKTAFTLSGAGSKRVPIARPQIVIRKTDGGIQAAMLFRDEERGSRASVAVCKNLGKEAWKVYDLTEDSLDHWEPTYDTELWTSDRILSVFALRVGQGDGETTESVPPQKLRILNIDAKTLFK